MSDMVGETLPLLAVSTFKNSKDNQPRPVSLPWERLRGRLTQHTERAQKNGSAWSPVAYKPGTVRGIDGVETICCFVGDVDDGTAPAALRERWEGLAWCLHSSHSSTPERSKWRVVFPLARPVPASEWPAVWRKLTAALLGEHFDTACKDASRLYFLPSCPLGGLLDAFADMQEGAYLDPDAYPDVSMEQEATASMRQEWKNTPKVLGQSTGDKKQPGTDYNERGDIVPLVERHGWQVVSDSGGRLLLRHPTATAEWSATFGYGDSRVFYPFTSSTAFKPRTGYSPFAVYAVLECGGDSPGHFKEAAKRLAAEGYGDQTKRAPKAKPNTTPGNENGEEGEQEVADLPVIVITGREDRDIAADAWAALEAANEPPQVFARDKGMVRLHTNADTRRAVVEAVDEQRILHRLRRVADFVTIRQTKDGEKESHAAAPARIAKDMLVDAAHISALPPLRAIMYAPVVGVSGKLLATPGYHKSDLLYLDTRGLPAAPDAPTKEEAQAAFARLFDKEKGVFGEFPYATNTDPIRLFGKHSRPRSRPGKKSSRRKQAGRRCGRALRPCPQSRPLSLPCATSRNGSLRRLARIWAFPRSGHSSCTRRPSKRCGNPGRWSRFGFVTGKIEAAYDLIQSVG